jgi:hypothetical protein
MRKHEVRDGFLVVLLVDRCGDDECVDMSKLQIGCKRRAILQLHMVPAPTKMRCHPLGNLLRLPFRRSKDYQNVHDIPPTVEETLMGTIDTPGMPVLQRRHYSPWNRLHEPIFAAAWVLEQPSNED